MRTLAMTVSAVLVATGAVAACGSDASDSPGQEQLAYAIVGTTGLGQFSSAVGGTLEWDGSCAYLNPENPDIDRYLAVFTRGTVSVEDGQINHGGELYQDGDDVNWPGVHGAALPEPELSGWAEVPEACTDFDEAVLVYGA